LGDRVSHWDINGCQIGPTYDGSHIAFSLDGKQFALCNKGAIIVQTFESRATIAKFHVTNGTPKHCCFSPNGKLIAAAVDNTAYVWDIASSDSHPIETFIGHTSDITALAFYSPSSLISASEDMSVKFWQIGTLSTESVETNLDPTSSPSHKVVSTTLQAKDGITITSDSDGTVRIWDISTGLCKASFQTPATGSGHRDGQFINGRLIFAWNVGKKIHIYGASEEELILVPRESESGIESLKIGGDGSIIFCLGESTFRLGLS
jgi:WD40 repeat protein